MHGLIIYRQTCKIRFSLPNSRAEQSLQRVIWDIKLLPFWHLVEVEVLTEFHDDTAPFRKTKCQKER
jgi:hypothetical protein